MANHDLALLGGPKTITSSEPQYVWPRITKEAEQAVVAQLHKSVSIYDSSGIFSEFETTFKNMHGMEHALLSNSGTNALFSLYFGIGIGPGDEVISPAYTFFASVAPVLNLGGVPVFCDAGADGNIDPSKIEALITRKTKAISITHMWGQPCDMDAIVDIAKRHNLLLVEDCSHAHGATYKGKPVGSFGVGAAWSLQGQKIITGGEGGIMLTHDPEVLYRALLQGHYNKRCKQQIPKDHPLAQFATSGFGLKFRAYPPAIALALEQLGHLGDWVKAKNALAQKFSYAFSAFEFFVVPKPKEGILPSWYAYVFQFVPENANGVTLDILMKAMAAEGLTEFDHPTSTAPIYNMPLFLHPEIAFPALYKGPARAQGQFPGADRFYANALKIPTWVYPDEMPIADAYIKALQKVATVIRDEPSLLKSI